MPEPYYQDDTVTIYHGDCRVILPTLVPLRFAALITDPPYGMAYKSNGGGNTVPNAVGWWFGSKVRGDEDTRLRDEILAWWGEVGPAFVFGTWKVQRPARTRALLIYDKGGATGMGDLSIPFKPSHGDGGALGHPLGRGVRSVTFRVFVGAVRTRLAIIDSRRLTVDAPTILPLHRVRCESTTKAPPRRVNGRGHGTEGVRSSMHEQSIPTRHDARPRRAGP